MAALFLTTSRFHMKDYITKCGTSHSHGKGLMLEIFWSRAAKLQILQEYFFPNICWFTAIKQIRFSQNLNVVIQIKQIYFIIPALHTHLVYYLTALIYELRLWYYISKHLHHTIISLISFTLIFTQFIQGCVIIICIRILFVHTSLVAHLQLGLLRGCTRHCATG